MLTTAFKIQSAKAALGTIYINPDGSITPSTANITSSDNVTYTFTSNNYMPIVVNRSNIIINGNGHTLQASEAKGFSLTDISNVTIRNTIIVNSSWGIFLYSSSDNVLSRNNFTANSRYGIELDNSSDNNVLSYNKITSGEVGIELCSSSGNILSDNNLANVKIGICLVSSSGNFLSDNDATVNSWFGILLGYSSSNILSGNSITANGVGVDLYDSSDNNNLFGNSITANSDYGGYLESSFGNTFYHNNFIGNAQQVFSDGSPNTWDNGYPSGGNYWSDYQTRYRNATEINSSAIWNTPYVINSSNMDNYPLMNPWTGHDIAITTVLLSKTIVGEGYSLNAKVAVANLGNYTETFNMTLYANTTAVATQRFSLASGASATIILTWNTIGFAYGSYTMSASVTLAPSETNTWIDPFTCGTVKVTIPGDINGDGVVNGEDLHILATYWLVTVPPAPANVDVGGYSVIGGRDLHILAANWLETT
jgi:parallel beta-helix repeat protein